MTGEQIKDIKPLVSIAITSYNRAHFIENAIDSALAQDYPNLEILISDNCSTDDTDVIIQKYLPDKRVKYFKNESNLGLYMNFRLITQKASGQYLSYLSSDDYFINDSFISDAIHLVNKYNNILLVLGKYHKFYEGTKKTDTENDSIFGKEYFNGNELFLDPRLKRACWAAALMHRETLLSMHPFDKPSNAMDIMVILKLMLMGNVALIDKPSYVLRIHDNNASTGINLQQAIDNFFCITEVYNAGLKHNTIPKKILDKWRFNGALGFTRFASVQIAPQSKSDYKKYINYVQANFPGVFEKLRLSFKWNVLIFFFKRPGLGLKFFKVISKNHYIYLKKLIEKGKEKVEQIHV